MEIKGFQTIEGIPAIYHPEMDLLVISDLHLGLEGSMTSQGSYVPKFNFEEVIEDIEKARSRTKASRVILNGDLKNEFKRSSYSEKQEIKNLLQHLKRRFEEVIIVEGNHDKFIEKTVEDEGLKIRNHFLEKGVLFVHGDERPEDFLDDIEYDTIVIGHEHPALSLEDNIGISEKIDCILYGETNLGKNLIVLPAFSEISNGTNVNEIPSHKLLSPILKEDVNKKELKAVAVSREAGNFKFPEIGGL